MKTVKEIEDEYKAFKPETEVVTNLDEFLTFIEIGLDDTDEYQADFEKELRENKLWELEAKIRNIFFFLFEEEETDFYGEDNRILGDCISYTALFRTFFKRIQKMANEQNFPELVKLVDFSKGYYESQTDYYDFLRDQLEMWMQGFQMYNSKYEDTRVAFTEFMNQKLTELEKKSQPKEKPKVYEKVSQ